MVNNTSGEEKAKLNITGLLCVGHKAEYGYLQRSVLDMDDTGLFA